MKQQNFNSLTEKKPSHVANVALFLALSVLGLALTGGLIWGLHGSSAADPFAADHFFKTPLLALHMLLGWAMMLFLGAIIPLHVIPQWEKHKTTDGLVLLGVVVVASMSGFFLLVKLPLALSEALLRLHRTFFIISPVLILLHLAKRILQARSKDKNINLGKRE